MIRPELRGWRRAAPWLVLTLAAVLGACRSGRPLDSDWSQRGMASWYGDPFHGRRTANGETFDKNELTAAHKTLPFGTVVEVTNLDNGQRVRVRINDRGPFVRGRIIDLSRQAAEAIDMRIAGTALVELRIVEVGAEAEGSLFTVQLGAFRERERAVRLAERVRAEEPQVRVERSQDGWYRVRVGAFQRRDEAEARRRELRRRGLSAVLVRVP